MWHLVTLFFNPPVWCHLLFQWPLIISYREEYPPKIQNSDCDDCPLCRSRSSNLKDSCSNINTLHGDSFYAMVVAHKVNSVRAYGRQIRGKGHIQIIRDTLGRGGGRASFTKWLKGGGGVFKNDRWHFFGKKWLFSQFLKTIIMKTR
jgi:hypothetical protein